MPIFLFFFTTGFHNRKKENQNHDPEDSDCSDYSLTLDEIPAESVIFSPINLPQMSRSRNTQKTGKWKKSGAYYQNNFQKEFQKECSDGVEDEVEKEVEEVPHFR